MENIETYDRVVGVGVDITNDFISGTLPVPEGETVVAPFNKSMRWVRQANGLVVFTEDEHDPANADHFAKWPLHNIKDTWGAQRHPDVEFEPGDEVVHKGTGLIDDGYSGFDGTTEEGYPLGAFVWPAEGERVAMVVGGLATDYCDKATVLDGLEKAQRWAKQGRHLGIFALADCMRAVDVNPGDGDRALQEMAEAGATLATSEDLINDRLIRVRG